MSLLAWLILHPAGPILVAPCLTFDALDVGQLAGKSVAVKFFVLSSGKLVLNEPPTCTVKISSRLEMSGRPVRP